MLQRCERPRARDDRGETLVELVVAVAVLGIAAVAILGGMLLSVKSSDIGRKYATSGAYVRSFAEAIQNHVDNNSGYVDCAAPGVYETAVRGTYGLDEGKYTPTSSKAWWWSGSEWKETGCTSALDGGLQRITVSVASKDGRGTESLTVVLRRPCNGNASAAGDNPCAP